MQLYLWKKKHALGLHKTFRMQMGKYCNKLIRIHDIKTLRPKETELHWV